MKAGKKDPSAGATEDHAHRVAMALAPEGGGQVSVRRETDAARRVTRDSGDLGVQVEDHKVSDLTAGINLVIAAGHNGETTARDRNRPLRCRKSKSR
jgi:hypothetical protein